MSTETPVQERIDRARSQPMSVSVAQDEPQLVLEIDNEEGSVHTVIPDILHCSCPDHHYRGYVCKHIAFAAMQDDEYGQAVRDALQGSADERLEDAEGYFELAENLREEAAQIDSVLGAARGDDGSGRQSLRELVNSVTGR